MNNINSYSNIIEGFKSYSSAIRNLSEAYIDTIINSVTLFIKFINEYKFKYQDIEEITLNDLRSITNTDVYNYLFDLAERNCASATRINRSEHIKSFFTYLYKIKHTVFNNPVSSVKTEKRLKQKLPNYLSLEDAKKMRDLYKDSTKIHEIRTNAIINLCLNAGLRINEVIELRISEFNFKENKFLIHGKGNKERTGYLNKVSKEAVEKYLEIRKTLEPTNKKDKDILFLSQKNKKMSYNTIRNFVKRSYTKANIDESKYALHTLRHTCATLLYKSGVDVRLIQEILGHSELDTTTIYTHIHDEEVKKSMLEHPLAHFKLEDALNYSYT